MPPELLSLCISTRVFCMDPTVLWEILNSLLMVWDLDICDAEEMEKGWSVASFLLMSTAIMGFWLCHTLL